MGDTTRANELAKQKKEAAKNTIINVLENEGEATIATLCKMTNVSPPSVRRYVGEMAQSGAIALRKTRGKRGWTYYIPSETQETKEEVKDVTEVLPPVAPEAKVFDPEEVQPASDICNQGDVVWASSRSGEGQSFRYLVVAPWYRKATVLGIYIEGNPGLDLNNPNHIYIGDDPEVGKKMYAIVDVVCSRGYKSFCRNIMHIDDDKLDDVKRRLARVYHMNGGAPVTNSVLESKLKSCAKEYSDYIKRTKEKEAKMKKEYDDLKEQSADQTSKLIGELDKANERITQLETDNYELEEKLQSTLVEAAETVSEYKDSENQLKETIRELNNELERLRNMAVEKPSENAELAAKLKSYIADLHTQIAVDEAKIAAYENEIETYKKMIFCMIKKGGTE